MHYLYTGDFSLGEKEVTMDQLVDILRVADQEFLDDVSLMYLTISDQDAL
jgi:hypothetical protein